MRTNASAPLAFKLTSRSTRIIMAESAVAISGSLLIPLSPLFGLTPGVAVGVGDGPLVGPLVLPQAIKPIAALTIITDNNALEIDLLFILDTLCELLLGMRFPVWLNLLLLGVVLDRLNKTIPLLLCLFLIRLSLFLCARLLFEYSAP